MVRQLEPGGWRLYCPRFINQGVNAAVLRVEQEVVAGATANQRNLFYTFNVTKRIPQPGRDPLP